MISKLLLHSLWLTVVGLFLVGCTWGGAPTEDKQLKIALIPVMDVLPGYVAQDKGYFKAEGLQVELLPVKGPQERDALIQAGEVDAVLTDLIGTALLNRDSSRVKVIIKARKAYPDFPLFRVLAAPGFPVSGPADMANVPVGISQNSVIEYLTARLLTSWGVPADQVAIEEVTAIPTRFELLMSGQLKAATLPDPMAQGALAAGASLIIDDSVIPQFAQSVLTFRTETLEKKPETVRAFLRAWKKAVADINQDPNAYRNVLIEKTRVPENIQGTFNVPPFPEGEITSEAEWADVVQWLQAKKLLDQPVTYQSSVDQSFTQ